MKPDDFIATMQRRTSVTAVGPSALRRQGKGVLKATQTYLGQLDLSRTPMSCHDKYLHWLDKQTESLLDALPIRNRPWGAARKALNLFMRDVLYNQYLNGHFGFSKLEACLEIPLDRAVATGLKGRAGHGRLPQWPGLKNLKPNTSKKFQDFASEYARRKRIEKVHLDVYLWLENR